VKSNLLISYILYTGLVHSLKKSFENGTKYRHIVIFIIST